jgi:2,4-dienoyl-CoA reductase-like NADH-dependent reductase (Old Yellow Enzyme family)
MSLDAVPDPFAPGRLGPLELRNRFIKAATYEGMTPGGLPSPALVQLHRRLAEGGVAMTTVAYAAVDRDGRTFAEQLWLRAEAVAPLRVLTRAVHEAGAKAAIQLGHCGAFSKLRPAEGGWPRGASGGWNAYGAASGLPVARGMRVDEIAALPGQFARAAELAEEAGFDAVELHLGHGYLLSQFLSPASNRRRDAWGGELVGRMRLPLAVVAAVRERVGGRLAVTAKINVEDGFDGGMPADEVLALAVALDAAGIDGVTTSGGSVSRNPLFLLRGARPLRAMVAVEKSTLQRVALRVLGPAVLRAYAFEETFFREAGRRVLEKVRCPVILLGGVVSRANAITAMEDGFAFVQLGRALLADPDLVQRFASGQAERTRCTACNQCIAAMDDGGVRCVLDDPGGVLVRRSGRAAAGAGAGDP